MQGATSTGYDPSGERSDCEPTCWEPKFGDLCLNGLKQGETLVEEILTFKLIVKFGYRGERLIEPSSSWFPPKFPSG